jgi:hypothetical protein
VSIVNEAPVDFCSIRLMDRAAKMVGSIMDNFRRGLHSYLGAGGKTSLGVCIAEVKH